jgi:hypothetical protein
MKIVYIILVELIWYIGAIRDGSFEIELSSYKDEQYYGDLYVDNKNYSVVFDTGSNLIWIQGKNTTMIDCNDYEDCKAKCFKNVSVDSSMIYFIKYGTGFVGIRNKVGDILLRDGFIIRDYEYGLSIFEDKKIFSEIPFRGIMGMSLNKASGILNNFNLTNKVFSFYFTPGENKLLFGDLKLKNGGYKFADVAHDATAEFNLWKIELEHFYVGDNDFCKSYRDSGEK